MLEHLTEAEGFMLSLGLFNGRKSPLSVGIQITMQEMAEAEKYIERRYAAERALIYGQSKRPAQSAFAISA